MKRSNTHKLAAAITAGMMVGSSEAFAGGQNFTNMTSNIVTSSGTLPNLISTVAYVGGIGLAVAGIFKLKQHVDNPGQTPMKDGLIRLGAGGGLLALPFMTEAMTNTISNGAGSAPAPATLQFGAASFT
jgi:hypothetical protein